MALLDQLRTSKRTEDTRQLLQKFQSTSAMIQAISNSLQGLQQGGKRHNKSKKNKKLKGGFIYGTSSQSSSFKTKKRQRGGFTYGTSSSFKRKINKSSKSSSKSFGKSSRNSSKTSLFNKNKHKNRKM